METYSDVYLASSDAHWTLIAMRGVVIGGGLALIVLVLRSLFH